MIGLKVDSSDLDDVRAALKALPEKVRQKVLVAAGRTAARAIRDEARALAPVKTGRLRRQLNVRLISKSPERVEFEIAPPRRGLQRAWYWWVVEGGAKPHAIRKKRKDGTPGKAWTHPGFQGRRYLARGYPLGFPKARRVFEAAVAGLARELCRRMEGGL